MLLRDEEGVYRKASQLGRWLLENVAVRMSEPHGGDSKQNEPHSDRTGIACMRVLHERSVEFLVP